MHIKEVPWAKMLGNARYLGHNNIPVYVIVNKNYLLSNSFAYKLGAFGIFLPIFHELKQSIKKAEIQKTNQ